MKDDFIKRINEEILFNEIKDSELVSAEYFRIKHKDKDVDYTRLYRRVNNYQIKKYGSSLSCRCDFMTKEEREKASSLNSQRHYHRRNK